jgi:hypothetical protein
MRRTDAAIGGGIAGIAAVGLWKVIDWIVDPHFVTGAIAGWYLHSGWDALKQLF